MKALDEVVRVDNDIEFADNHNVRLTVRLDQDNEVIIHFAEDKTQDECSLPLKGIVQDDIARCRETLEDQPVAVAEAHITKKAQAFMRVAAYYMAELGELKVWERTSDVLGTD